jgi:hypothetical protein
MRDKDLIGLPQRSLFTTTTNTCARANAIMQGTLLLGTEIV